MPKLMAGTLAMDNFREQVTAIVDGFVARSLMVGDCRAELVDAICGLFYKTQVPDDGLHVDYVGSGYVVHKTKCQS